MLRVLKTETEKTEARRRLEERGLSALPGTGRALLQRLGLSGSVPVGDIVKSWDVLATVEFVESRFAHDAALLDIGAYACEVPVALHRLGYRSLTAVDLDPKLLKMPHADAIRYQVCDFMRTPFGDASFSAITSISVIEHGYQPEHLLREVSRLLAPGGCLVASFDYWPEKIDTADIRMFDMSWTILSRTDVEELVRLAANFGLYPVGDLCFDAGDALIECAGRKYTFGWLALEKRNANA